MSHYLANLRASDGWNRLSLLMPDGACPFLFYNLTPYIFTLAHQGRFGWVRHLPRDARRAPRPGDFSGRQVNYLYENEVLVRCPNPQNMVVAGIGTWGEDKLKLRILHAEAECACRHLAGQEIILEKSAAHDAASFNRVFPGSLVAMLKGQPASGTHCQRTPGGIVSLFADKIIYPCRYHKAKKEFNPPLLPDGFCPHLFQAFYPQVLATMYRANVSPGFDETCPAGGCAVRLQLEKQPRFKSPLTKLGIAAARRVFEAFFHPVDVIDYELRMRVERSANRSAECPLQDGKAYPVNLHSLDSICPASFHALYPYLLAAAAGRRMIWNRDDGRDLLPCPDCVGVVYSVNKRCAPA